MNISSITSLQTATPHTQPQARLTDAAQQFEGIFLQEFLKPLQSGKDGLTGEDSSDSSTDTLQTYGTEALAKAISSRGGFGIAHQVIQQVNREHQNTRKNLSSR
jgi:Rod binding domain-containing protein